MIYRFYLLGELRVFEAERELEPPPLRAQGLLGLLLLRPDLRQRSQIIGRLYPDSPEQQGRRRLSDGLYLLRKSFPLLELEGNSEKVWLPRQARWLDVEQFRRLAAGEDVQEWLSALRLFEGALLDGNYEDWILDEREALNLDYACLAQRAAKAFIQQRDYERALPLLESLSRREPYDESAQRMFMQALYAAGRRGAALAAYDRLAARIRLELDIEPEEATQNLAQTIRQAQPVISPQSLTVFSQAGRDNLIAGGCQALERGEWSLTRHILAILKQRRGEAANPQMQLLEIDLALYEENFELAQKLLAAIEVESAEILIRRAELIFQRRRFDEACEIAQRALVLSHESGDSAMQARALITLGYAQAECGGGQPLRCLEQAARLARTCGRSEILARALVVTARILTMKHQFDSATLHLNEALVLTEAAGLRRYQAIACRVAAWVQFYQGNLIAAIELYEQALNIWRDLGLPGQEARLLMEIAEGYFLLGDSARALQMVESAQAILSRLDRPVQYAINLYHHVYALIYHNDHLADRAIRLARQALQTFSEYNQPAWVARMAFVAGYALWVNGQPREALDMLDLACERFESLGDPTLITEIQAHKAIAWFGLGDLAQAEHWAAESLIGMLRGEMISEHAGVDVYFANAIVQAARGRQTQAEKYLEQAYGKLVEMAAQVDNEAGRRAFFFRSPITRRLMVEAYRTGIAPQPNQGVIRRMIQDDSRRMVEVTLTLDAGPPDQSLRKAKGALRLRRERLKRLVREAERQGVQLTNAQLAEMLGISIRTVQRDRKIVTPEGEKNDK